MGKMAKKLEPKYWKSKQKAGKAAWAIDCRPHGKLQFFKTKAEAQAVIDAEITAAQNAWDALPDEEKAPANPLNIRPVDVILP